MSVCLSVTQLCPLYGLKTVESFFPKLHTQISNIRYYAESKNSKSGIMSTFELWHFEAKKERTGFLRSIAGKTSQIKIFFPLYIVSFM